MSIVETLLGNGASPLIKNRKHRLPEQCAHNLLIARKLQATVAQLAQNTQQAGRTAKPWKQWTDGGRHSNVTPVSGHTVGDSSDISVPSDSQAQTVDTDTVTPVLTPSQDPVSPVPSPRPYDREFSLTDAYLHDSHRRLSGATARPAVRPAGDRKVEKLLTAVADGDIEMVREPTHCPT